MHAQLKQYFSVGEQKLIDSLDTPEKVQEFVDHKITYDPDREDRSVKQVIADRKGECYNGALFAVMCLLSHNIEASVLEMLAREDEEHILCVYKHQGKFGSIAQSKFLGLKGRKPIYSSIRDLVISYQEFYFAWDGRYSLDSYTNLIKLEKYAWKWIFDAKTVVQMGKDLRKAKHFALTAGKAPEHYVSPERYWREVLVIPKGTKISKRYFDNKP